MSKHTLERYVSSPRKYVHKCMFISPKPQLQYKTYRLKKGQRQWQRLFWHHAPTLAVACLEMLGPSLHYHTARVCTKQKRDVHGRTETTCISSFSNSQVADSHHYSHSSRPDHRFSVWSGAAVVICNEFWSRLSDSSRGR